MSNKSLADSAPDPGKLLDPNKVKGYSVSTKYLSGVDTSTPGWISPTNFFSTQGLEICLKSKSHKENDKSLKDETVLTMNYVQYKKLQYYIHASLIITFQYIFLYFIPTTLFTFTSWVSYIIPPTVYPAR